MKMRLLNCKFLMAIMLFFLSSGFCFSQLLNLEGRPSQIVIKEEPKYTTIGSQFLTDDFVDGIILSDYSQVTQVKFRFNKLRNEFEVVGSDGSKIWLSKKYREIKMLVPEEISGNKELLFKNIYSLDGYKSDHYFQVFELNGLVLLKDFYTEVIDAQIATYGAEGGTRREYRTKERYYLVTSTDSQEIKRTKASVMSYFVNEKEVIKDFFNKGFKLETDRDLVSLLEYVLLTRAQQ